jgi:dienelactone hydrolase
MKHGYSEHGAAGAAGVVMAPRAAGIEFLTASFRSGRRDIRVDVTRPAVPMAGPGVLLLHGSLGCQCGAGSLRDIAVSLAAQGYTALRVHYFDRTQTRSANYACVLLNSERWIATVLDAVAFAITELAIDPGAVASCGYSLGGFLTIAHAARDPRVRAAVVISGGIDPFTVRKVKRLPAALVLHGDADRWVRPFHARRLCASLEAVGAPYNLHWLPGEGHRLSARAKRRVLKQTVGFLDEHLMMERVTTESRIEGNQPHKAASRVRAG